MKRCATGLGQVDIFLLGYHSVPGLWASTLTPSRLARLMVLVFQSVPSPARGTSRLSSIRATRSQRCLMQVRFVKPVEMRAGLRAMGSSGPERVRAAVALASLVKLHSCQDPDLRLSHSAYLSEGGAKRQSLFNLAFLNRGIPRIEGVVVLMTDADTESIVRTASDGLAQISSSVTRLEFLKSTVRCGAIGPVMPRNTVLFPKIGTRMAHKHNPNHAVRRSTRHTEVGEAIAAGRTEIGLTVVEAPLILLDL